MEKQIGEIEIKRVLRPEAAPEGYRCVNGYTFPASAVTGARELLAELEGCRAQGARAVLVRIDCAGGDQASSLAIYGALRRLSAGGVPVVAHLSGWNASAAPWIALAADLVIADPAASIALHSAESFGPTDVAREASRRRCNAEQLAILVERSGADPAWLAAALEGRYDPATKRMNGAILTAAEAEERCLVDLVGDLEAARGAARLLAGGGHIRSRRLRADNLFPNPTSEVPPLPGLNPAAIEWAGRVNAGSGAYAGAWVREITSPDGTNTPLGFTQVCNVGERFYFEAMLKRVVGTGSGYVSIEALDAGGTVLQNENSSAVTAATWTKATLTSSPMPAGTVSVRFEIEVIGGARATTFHADQMLIRRVVQEAHLADGSITSGKISPDTLRVVEFDISGTNTTYNVGLNPNIPDAKYVVVAHVKGADTTAPDGALIVADIRRWAHMFTLECRVAPGTGKWVSWRCMIISTP